MGFLFSFDLREIQAIHNAFFRYLQFFLLTFKLVWKRFKLYFFLFIFCISFGMSFTDMSLSILLDIIIFALRKGIKLGHQIFDYFFLSFWFQYRSVLLWYVCGARALHIGNSLFIFVCLKKLRTGAGISSAIIRAALFGKWFLHCVG